MTTTAPVTRARVEATRDAWRLRFAHLVSQREQAMATFEGVTAGYVERYGDTYVAEFRAAGDPRQQQAIADAAWLERQIDVAQAVIARLDRALGGAR